MTQENGSMIEDHKKAYIDLMSLIEYGGQWNCRWHAGNVADILLQALQVMNEVQEGSKEREFVAQSPWQAAIWLLFRSMLLADETFLPEARAGKAKQFGLSDIGTTITIFRGQRNPSYGFSPSIKQPHLTPQQRETASCATKIFCNVLHDLYVGSGGAHVEANGFTAIAQHYDMRTSLLDFTTDPSIGVFFGQYLNKEGELGATYYVPLATVLKDIRIILPPPFVARLYRQRGFFVDVPGPDANDLHKVCGRILFPAKPDFVPHRRINNSSGDYRILVLPGDRLLEDVRDEAVRLAPSVLKRMEIDNEAKAIAKEIIDRLNLQTRFQNLEKELDEWLIAVELFISEIAIKRNGESGVIQIAEDVLDKISADNQPIADLLMRLAHSQSKILAAQGATAASVELQLAERIARSLAKARYLSGSLDLPKDLALELGLE